MNHTVWAAAGARVLAMAFVIAGLAACSDRVTTTSKGRESAAPESSAVVVGVAPAQPTGDPPGTTPVASGTTYVTKDVEDKAMPVPGQPNDHSNLAAKPPQKAETPDALHSVEAAKNANSGTAERSK